LLGFGRRYVTDGLQESPVVEPVYPFQRRELDGFERAPSCSSMDELGLIEAIDRLGESVVVGIATLPTEGSTPASARRSVYLIETY
jgi:hypothetical protein